MADKKPPAKPAPKPKPDSIGAILLLVIILGTLMRTNWGRKFLLGTDASSTSSVATSSKVVNYTIGQ